MTYGLFPFFRGGDCGEASDVGDVAALGLVRFDLCLHSILCMTFLGRTELLIEEIQGIQTMTVVMKKHRGIVVVAGLNMQTPRQASTSASKLSLSTPTTTSHFMP